MSIIEAKHFKRKTATVKPKFDTEKEKDSEHDRLVSLLNFERYAIDQSHFSVFKETEAEPSEEEKSKVLAKLKCYEKKLGNLQENLKQSQTAMIIYFKNKLGDSKSSTAIQAPYRSDKPRVYKQYGEMIQLKGKVLPSAPEIKINIKTCSSEQRQGQPACKKTTACIKPVKLQINVSPFNPTKSSDLFSQRTQCAAALAAEGGKINKKK